MSSYETLDADGQIPTHVDLAIVTALTDELEPVLNLIDGGHEQWRKFTIDGFLHYAAKFPANPRPLDVVACSLWDMGGGPTTAQIVRLKQIRPRLIAMTGICAGREDKSIRLGDVIVAERAYRPEGGKHTSAGFIPDTRTYNPPPWLMQWLKNFTDDRWIATITTPRPFTLRYQREWLLCQLAERGSKFPTSNEDWAAIKEHCTSYADLLDILQEQKILTRSGKLSSSASVREQLKRLRAKQFGTLQPTPDSSRPHVYYNAFASLEAVVAIEKPFQKPAEQVRSVGAIEMEVASLFAAAQEINVPAFAVKGVSDYGTPFKDDAFRKYAAEAAARWMYAFITSHAGSLDKELPGKLDSSATPHVYFPERVHNHTTVSFCGREEELGYFDKLLCAEEPPSRIPVLTGVGGIGKTHLAVKFADKYLSQFPGGVFWLDMGDPLGVKAQVASFAGPRAFSFRDLTTNDDQYEAVRHAWMDSDRRLLLILDNLEEPKSLDHWRFLLNNPNCRLLVTSRQGFWESHAGVQEYALKPLLRSDSLRLILPTACGVLPKRTESIANQICEKLGDLPLALSLARAYLEITGNLEGYLVEIERQKQVIMHRSLSLETIVPLPTDHQTNIQATFAVSYNQVKKNNDILALQIFHAAAHFYSTLLPSRLLARAISPNKSLDEFDLKHAIVRLASLGIIEISDKENSGVSMHQLLAEFAQIQEEHSQYCSITDIEHGLLQETWEAGTKRDHRQMGILSPHLRHFVKQIEEKKLESSQVAKIYNLLGYFSNAEGERAAAIAYYRKAVISLTRQPEEQDIMISLDNLTFSIQKGAPDSEDLMISLGNLASSLQEGSSAERKEARSYLKSIVILSEAIFGRSDPRLVLSLTGLGRACLQEGELPDARKYLERACEVIEGDPTPYKPHLATTLSSLAELEQREENYTKALQLFTRALEIDQAFFDREDHPDLAIRLNYLGILHYRMKAYEKAKECFGQALALSDKAIEEELLREDHPQVMDSLVNLTRVCSKLKLYKEVDKYRGRIRNIKEMTGN